MFSILIVDDEPELRKYLVSLLSREGYSTAEASDGLEALQMLQEREFALVISDVRMPGLSGLELVSFIKEKEFSTSIVLVTAHANIRDAISAIRAGAFDYLEKPLQEEQVFKLIKKAKEAYEWIHKITYSAPILSSSEGQECVGQSRSMKRVFQLVERLSRVNTSVLVRGENGTGKELVARAIHCNSSRKNGPFVAVNCAAIPENLIESELFGHEKGAFTGADQRKIGKFQFANQGTLFLDEIGDTTQATQVKLLRALQEHAITPVGSPREVKIDVRIIAATNRDLESMIRDSTFREDLYYRLNVMPIFLPPLRQRKDDIPSLVTHFIEKFNKEHTHQIKSISEEALETLENFHWPGNIRELENAIEHAFVVETTERITFQGLPEYIRKYSRRRLPGSLQGAHFAISDLDWEKGKEVFEKEFIIQALKKNQGKINVTAEQANIPKNTLLRKIRKYQINPKEFGESVD